MNVAHPGWSRSVFGVPDACKLLFVQRLAGYGKVLAEARERRGWSQAELGRKAGVSTRTVQRCEAEDGFPALDTLDALLAALNLRLRDLDAAIAEQHTDAHVAEPTPPYPDVSRPALDPLDALLESAVASLSGLVAAVKERDRKM